MEVVAFALVLWISCVKMEEEKLSWKLYRELFPYLINHHSYHVSSWESLWQCLKYGIRYFIHKMYKCVWQSIFFWSHIRLLSSSITLSSCYFVITTVYSETILEELVSRFIMDNFPDFFKDRSLWRTVFLRNKKGLFDLWHHTYLSFWDLYVQRWITCRDELIIANYNMDYFGSSWKFGWVYLFITPTCDFQSRKFILLRNLFSLKNKIGKSCHW